MRQRLAMGSLPRLDALTPGGLPAAGPAPAALIGFYIGGIGLLGSMTEVAEVVSPLSLSRVPGVQSWVAGLANLRGRILPVFDLTRLFGLSVQGGATNQRLLIVEEGERAVGLQVDRLVGVHLPGQGDIPPGEPPQPDLAGPFAPYAVRLHRRDGAVLHEISLRSLLRSPGLRHLARH